MKKISFPKDGGAHNKIIEWWYFNGHLKGADGRNYSFMNCLFKANTKKVKIPLLKLPLKTVYFSHSILSDISRQKFYPVIDYVSIMSRQSFKRPLLFAEYISADPLDAINGFVVNLIEESPIFNYHIKTENFDLKVKALKKPLLEGGKGFLNLHGRKTYYYSLSDMSAEGQIYMDNKVVNVSGRAWMDHQWANAPYNKDKWTWFSIQLENHVELVVVEYGNEKKDSLADLCLADGKQEHYKNNEIALMPVKAPWKSPRTGASYELSWRIAIPKRKIFLEIEPLIKNQEMVFGTLNYWEGPFSVKGFFDGKAIKGKGFMELVGRDSKYKTASFFKEAIVSAAKNLKKKIEKK